MGWEAIDGNMCTVRGEWVIYGVTSGPPEVDHSRRGHLLSSHTESRPNTSSSNAHVLHETGVDRQDKYNKWICELANFLKNRPVRQLRSEKGST